MNDYTGFLLQISTEWIQWGGIGLLAALVFVETGFLIGLIVPGGETLLFSAGILAGVNTFNINVYVLVGLLIAAAILGDMTGFFIGRQLSDRIRNQPDGFLYKKRYWEQTEQFYQRNPRWALLAGRFLPIIRTFNPLIAATSGMPWPMFMLLTSIGCATYITVMVLTGYWLGQWFPAAGQYIKYIFMGVVALVVATLLYKAYQSRNVVS